MDETAFNAQLVTTRLKRGFCHLKSVDCRRSDVWKSFGCQWKEWVSWYCCLLGLVSGVEFLVVFRQVRLGKACGMGRCGLEVCECGAGAGKISQTPAGRGQV